MIIAPDECFLHHTCPPISRLGRDPPPENVNRLQVLLDKKRGILRSAEFSGVEMVSEVRPATMADVLRVHEYPYVRKIQRICERIPDWNTSPNGALGTIDGDTEVCHDSFTAALCAAGAVVEAVDRVVAGSAEKVFCAVRPPGHHVPNGPVPAPGDPIGSGSHGFCLLNNVALGAAYARCVHRHSLRRVAIIDFDVHHGNVYRGGGGEHHPRGAKIRLLDPLLRWKYHRAHVPPVAGRDGPRGGVLRLGPRIRSPSRGYPLLPWIGSHRR